MALVQQNSQFHIITFLRACYKFVNFEWHHLPRHESPDQGFESEFRINCVRTLNTFTISHQREMSLGTEADTSSGIRHEIDLVAHNSEALCVVEMKNRNCSPDKNDIILFFAKLVDYLTHNPTLLHKEVTPVFMSAMRFDTHALAACMGLGIHPVCPGLRPLPILIDTVNRIANEAPDLPALPEDMKEDIADTGRLISRLQFALGDTWMSNRFGYYSDDRIVVKSTPFIEVFELAEIMNVANLKCTEVLYAIREIKRLVAK